jgi:hypothetical protein
MTAVWTACTEALELSTAFEGSSMRQAAGGEVAELVSCALKLGNVN